jgi:photolyase PhrII
MTDLRAALPPHLAERVRPLGPHAPRPGGAYVAYWMRTAVRGHENPALDAALHAAAALGVPVFVHHALSERYPHASDRHHAFILEGARDVQAELAARGVPYAFHLERPGHRGPVLKEIAARAALVVTEDMPVAPLDRWAAAVAEAGPLWLADTACVVPMNLVGRAYERAFAFRKATEGERRVRAAAPWADAPVPGGPALPDLPYEPLDLQDADIPALVAACAIDHAVGPVAHTPGGSRAGYARWEAFKARGLRRYADRRNDALDRDGVSRMSAYLHYGHVSPFRLAREALAVGGAGAEKWLDEMMVWRELAYVFCRFRPDHATLEGGVPGWARDGLRAAEGDRRDALLSRETMARARTGDPVWDAAQRSLLVQGELHNNLRMTWGKAPARWTPDAASWLAVIEDLNHRYALDGRDPSSYGGLLWCLGQFDRPFAPPSRILGPVRPRSTSGHGRRLDVAAFAARAGRPASGAPLRIAVVGAGLAGLTAARTLADHGHEVAVFDKGRGPGGRLSTRRTDLGPFDHGAQYFTARDRTFRRHVESWVHDGVAARWEGRVVRISGGGTEPSPGERFVGTPGMSALARHMAADLPDVRTGTRIDRIAGAPGAWTLGVEDGTEAGPFDAVLVCVPPAQATPLLDGVAPDLAAVAAGARMAPCWAVMATLARPADPGFDAAFVADGPLSWIARDASKPGRPAGERWVLHASPAWSEAHLEQAPDAVAPALVAAFAGLVGGGGETVAVSAHRWRYALPVPALEIGAAYDPALGLGLGGDWCAGARVEGAFLSGAALAGRVLGRAG